MIKLTVLYGHPENAEAFESYYSSTHLPLAAKMQGVARIELTRFLAAPDGEKPAFYRMAELYFANEEQMRATLASPEAQATVENIGKFATGGATMVVGAVQD